MLVRFIPKEKITERGRGKLDFTLKEPLEQKPISTAISFYKAKFVRINLPPTIVNELRLKKGQRMALRIEHQKINNVEKPVLVGDVVE